MRVSSFRLGAGAIIILMGSAAFAGETTATDQSKTTTSVQTEKQSGPTPEVVQVEPVPEPSTGLLLCVAGLAALGRRNRR
jgi:hypothetical protein